ncbi:hypothetical protein [Beggiatoa leptomitoformis]|uniref:Uncharacterized protein n=1 Tax=Beggiatoa leptomitoformis TaxID=288004 RepID=A0A2N9YF39_9GAMM|nr:hypothetical protein [Beggiatoa leptomitoformis]ALG68562.1 hypothetical protein AL038_13720 [Beggiatoa leptomitoformis]AUI69093.1 hypothetical protein BLE401_10540 [Beggiatoa leptomitoformis]
MTRQEKRLLTLFLAMLLGYAIPFEIAPKLYAMYQARKVRMEALQTEIDRYQRLDVGTQYWQEQHVKAIQERDKFNTSLLQGNNRELVAARMQGVLREIAQRSSLTVRALDLPEFSRTGEWVLVTQGVQFESDSQTLFNFIQAVETAHEYLAIVFVEARIGRGNNLLSGTVKVTGFSRIPLTDAELAPK